jgi:hypothetical protein
LANTGKPGALNEDILARARRVLGEHPSEAAGSAQLDATLVRGFRRSSTWLSIRVRAASACVAALRPGGMISTRLLLVKLVGAAGFEPATARV